MEKSENELLQGMRKDCQYWKLEYLRDKEEVKKALFESLQSWKRTLGDVCLASPHRVASAVMGKEVLSEKLLVLSLRDIQVECWFALRDSAWVADDKAKTMAWMANKVRFRRAVVALVEQDPAHWSKETTSPEDQGNINWDLHRRIAKAPWLSDRRARQVVFRPAYLTCTCRSKASVIMGVLMRGDLCAKRWDTRISVRSAHGTNMQQKVFTEAQAEQCR